MKRNLFIQSALVLSLLLTPLCATELYDDKKVGNIEIVVDSPDSSIDAAILKNRLETRKGDKFSQTIFDKDLKALAEPCDTVNPIFEQRDGQLYITIHITPKPKIHQINFKFAHPEKQRFSNSTLQSELDVKPGTEFNRADFTKAFNKLRAHYFKKGYFEAIIDYTTIPVEGSSCEVDILITIDEGRPGKIKKIELEGFTKSEQADITEQMYLKKYIFLYSWVAGNGMYSDEAMDHDRTTIQTYLLNKGYADAHIDIKLDEAPESDKLILKIIAHRGAQFHIGTIDIEGNTLATTEELKSKIAFESGSIYSPQKIQECTQIIKDFYGHKGYIDASVNYEANLDEEQPIFNLFFTVDEGKQYKIGLIHIFGNSSTEDNVILRESLLVPGENFDSKKLKATQQRLEAVGYFKSVNAYAVRTDDETTEGENYRDVHIEVEEASTGNVSLFMGFSSSDSVFGGLDLTERNFHIANIGKAIKGDLGSLRGGGEYFHVRGTAGSKQNNVLVSWLNPYVNDSLWRLGVEVSTTFSELQSHDTKVTTYGGSVYTSYPISNYWTAGMRQRVREVVDKLNLHPIDDSAVAAASLAHAKSEFQRDGVVSAFSGNIGYDTVDSSFRPHRGLRSYFEPEIAGIGGRFQFGKITYTNTLYVPVWKKGTFKFRGDLKFLFPFGNTDKANAPYSERFFLGGDATMRGYKAWQFGPRIDLENAAGEQVPTDTPKGGLSMAYFSAEYNQEIFRMLDVFAFCDVGSLSANILDLDKFRATAGGGLRIDLGNRAPIMIGWGYVFNDKDREDKKQPFFFSMGGQF
jgi:outer membrane protein insertion porin family